MSTYPHPGNRGVPFRHPLLPLLPLLLLTLLILLSGCSASTTTGSPPTPTTTRGLKGTISEFPLSASNSYADGITAGPDGNLWFTEITSNAQSATAFTGKIGRITPAGHAPRVLPVRTW
jgi:hypothetical protein